MAVGCAYNETFTAPPSPLDKLAEVVDVLQAVDERGYGERFPDEAADLQARYEAARHAYYSRSQDSSALSMGIVADATALMNRPPPNQAPVARFSAPPVGRAHETILFDASESVDPEGDPLIYTWNFGDGATPQVSWPQVEHRYAIARTYVVRLTVSDSDGASDTASRVIAVAQPMMIPRPAIVLFDFDAADLKADAQAQLGEVVQAMKQQPGLQVDVVGHASAEGTESYNLALSQRRAQVVSDHLVSSGVAASRISSKWRGESEPAFPNTTDEFRALNRRAEVTVRPPM
jgi:outer membrane protein OmpA-like peptidoglycan-associated protein